MRLAIALLVALSTQAVDTELRPERQVSRALAPGETHRFTVAADAGDLVKSTLQVSGTEVTFEIRDPAGQMLARRTLVASDSTPTGREMGFVAHVPGQYVVQIQASGASPKGSYTLLTSRQSADERLRGYAAPKPKSDAPSPRIARLERDISAGVRGAEETFWSEVARSGGPFVEGLAGQDDVLVTFVWRQTFPVSHVLLLWWGGGDNDYYMSRVPGSSLWHTTLRVRDDSRFGYAISPNDRTEDRVWTLEFDPLNRKRFPDTEGLRAPAALSVFEMPRAPDMTWVYASAPQKGMLQDIRLESTTFTEAPILATVYTPPGYQSGAARYPLLILFDGWEYAKGGIQAPAILDNLIAAGRIRPVVVCFVDFPVRRRDAQIDSPFLVAVATEVVPQLRSRYAISGSASELIIGGFSAGATAAAGVAFRYPTVFGNMLSQSAHLREPGPASATQSVEASAPPNRIARLYAEGEPRPVRFYLDVGLYEPNTERNREWKAALTARGYDVVYRERGATHERLHFAGTLPEALMALLPPNR